MKPLMSNLSIFISRFLLSAWQCREDRKSNIFSTNQFPIPYKKPTLQNDPMRQYLFKLNNRYILLHRLCSTVVIIQFELMSSHGVITVQSTISIWRGKLITGDIFFLFLWCTEACSESSQTSKMEPFTKIFYGYLTFLVKRNHSNSKGFWIDPWCIRSL